LPHICRNNINISTYSNIMSMPAADRSFDVEGRLPFQDIFAESL
jgi:hypothetical protein